MGNRDMRTPGTKLLAAENELKLLMADVARAMEKAENAVARIAGNAVAATAATEAAVPAHEAAHS